MTTKGKGVCVEAFSRMEKYTPPQKKKSYTKHITNMYVCLIQEFSLNESDELKSVTSSKQNILNAFVNKHLSWKTSRQEVW